MKIIIAKLKNVKLKTCKRTFVRKTNFLLDINVHVIQFVPLI